MESWSEVLNHGRHRNQTIVYFRIARRCCARHDYLRLLHVTALQSVSRRRRCRLHRGMFADQLQKADPKQGLMDFPLARDACLSFSTLVCARKSPPSLSKHESLP
jgi:hypothetical protein